MTYRTEPRRASLAKVEGRELHVPGGTRLPRVCLMCGTRRRVRVREHELVWRPVGGLLTSPALMGWLGALLGSALKRTARLHFAQCKACKLRASNQQILVGVVTLIACVGLLVAASVGLNGWPITGVLIVPPTFALVAVVYRAFRKPTLSVAWIHGDGTIALRGVSDEAARVIVEGAAEDLEERDENAA